jgi:hypothetical protein
MVLAAQVLELIQLFSFSFFIKNQVWVLNINETVDFVLCNINFSL